MDCKKDKAQKNKIAKGPSPNQKDYRKALVKNKLTAKRLRPGIKRPSYWAWPI
jgi:hypothetical protein